jgi:short-subunit dehydrogenase
MARVGILEDKLALVTGASSGIGHELAKELAHRGYDVVVASAGERLGEAAEDIRGRGHQVVEVSVDLATRKGVEQLWGQVHPLVVPLTLFALTPASVSAVFFGTLI